MCLSALRQWLALVFGSSCAKSELLRRVCLVGTIAFFMGYGYSDLPDLDDIDDRPACYKTINHDVPLLPPTLKLPVPLICAGITNFPANVPDIPLISTAPPASRAPPAISVIT